MAANPKRFDIFCRVVDNYGDAGVALRLGRQLVAEHGAEATLWIDDVASLARITAGISPETADQAIDGVRIRALCDPFVPDALPDVVVEAFGCGLPEPYLDAMQDAAKPPVWIVLEYLSAEHWVEGAHGLPSPHPRRPLSRWFYFPGFTAGTGGLLRERDLFARRDAIVRDAAARDACWAALGVPPAAEGALTVSLFCYPTDALAALFEAWADDDAAVRCVVPEGVATASLDRYFGGAVPHAGESRTTGTLTLAVVPFVDQAAFDRRLWISDANLVRGEDSFLRAQWAARPFAWHIYPQESDAHLPKLEAFLDRYAAGLDAASDAAYRAFVRALNGVGPPEALASAWAPFRGALPVLALHAAKWASHVARLPVLPQALVEFARNRL